MGLALATLAPLLIEPRPLHRRRCHLREMDEGGLVFGREGPVLLVEELDGAQLGAVEGGQGRRQPALKRALAADVAKRRDGRELLAAGP